MPEPEDSRSPDPFGERTHLIRRYTRLSVINVISNLTVPMVGLIDTAMLGHLQQIHFLAGVALAGLLFDYLYWGLGFLRMATTGLAAQARGRGDEVEGTAVLLRAFAIALGFGVLILLLRTPIEGAGFRLLSGGTAVEEAGREYFAARIWGAPAALANLVLLGWFLGREEAGRALAVTVVGNVANVAFNWWFIIRLGMAAAGAGWASMLGQYCALLVGLGLAAPILLTSSTGLGSRSASRSALRSAMHPAALAELFRLNGHLFARTLLLISSFALFVDSSAVLGAVTLAANAILLRVLSLASFLIDGCAFATESLAGIFHGAGDRTSQRRLLGLSLTVGEALALLFLVPALTLPRPFFRILTSHQDVVDIATGLAFWLIPVLLMGALAYILDGFFLGITAGPTLSRAMAMSTLLFLPLVLLGRRSESVTLLWLSMAVLMAGRVFSLGLPALVYLRGERA